MTTAIQWTDETWNPVTGCDKVSPGCDHCYAESIANRFAGSRAFPNGFALTLHPERLDQPLRWKRPRRVFVNSMSDLFHPDVPHSFISHVWRTMLMASQHTFQILTKRPQRMAESVRFLYGQWAVYDEWNGVDRERWPMSNVWLGTSIENDRYAFRADHLRSTPAAVRFVSAEPLIGPVPSLDLTGIDWLIVGGESGRGARPLELDWVRDLRDRCAASGTALFVKQLGTAWSQANGRGFSHAGDPDHWPDDLRIREWPTTA